MKRLLVLVAMPLLLLAGCSEASPASRTSVPVSSPSPALQTSGACPITRAAPIDDVPVEAARPILSGSSHPENARANLSMVGNDAMWATLPRGAASLDDRWFVVRLVPSQVSASARRLDEPAPPATFHIPEGYGTEGLQVVGITFPTTGCWELTYHLDRAPAHELRITMLVAPRSAP